MFLQKSIRARTRVEGVGLHSGASCGLTFIPAPPNSGVHFIRADLPGCPSIRVNARSVTATGYATTLGGNAFSVSTVEHCLAAVSALRIDNLWIELDGPEIPITDGSAAPFLAAIQKVGMFEQEQPRKYFVVKDTVSLTDGDKYAEVRPYHGLRITAVIDFPHPAIGKQQLDLDINEKSFSREIARARTFGFLKDVEALQAKGLALGGSLDNAIVLDDSKIINSEGLRWPDEFVRHKALDALGDLVTLGFPLMGHITLYKAGHDLMNKFVLALMNNTDRVKLMELGADLTDAHRLRHDVDSSVGRFS